MDSEMIQYISNILSTLTILSCLFLKIPQIISIRTRKSAEGVYVQAMVMEIVGFTIMSLYNFTNGYNIMTYMEYVIILLEIYVLFYYVLLYKRMLNLVIVRISTALYFVLVIAFVIEWLPKEILSVLVPFCTPLSGFAKVSYIYGIVSTGNADSIALTTWIISVSTNVARIFTVYVDSGDITLIINFVISSLLSAGVLGSAVYYQNEPRVPPGQRRLAHQRRNHHDD